MGNIAYSGFSSLKWLSSVRPSRRKRRYPIRRDAEGRSARARAFEFFEQGLRPSELPDLGVTQPTLYRYFESWKHRDREALDRIANRILRQTPDLQQKVAASLGLSLADVADASAQRNPRAALQPKIRARLLLLLDRLDLAAPEEIQRVGALLHAYRGRDRTELVCRFTSWAETVLRAHLHSEQSTAVLVALHHLKDDVNELRRVRRLMRNVFG